MSPFPPPRFRVLVVRSLAGRTKHQLGTQTEKNALVFSCGLWLQRMRSCFRKNRRRWKDKRLFENGRNFNSKEGKKRRKALLPCADTAHYHLNCKEWMKTTNPWSNIKFQLKSQQSVTTVHRKNPVTSIVSLTEIAKVINCLALWPVGVAALCLPTAGCPRPIKPL